MSFLTQKRYLYLGYKKEEAYTAHWTVTHNQVISWKDLRVTVYFMKYYYIIIIKIIC